jgi:hypothetical protein
MQSIQFRIPIFISATAICFTLAAAQTTLAADAPSPAQPDAPKHTLQYKFKPGEIIRTQVLHRVSLDTTIAGTTQTAETTSQRPRGNCLQQQIGQSPAPGLRSRIKIARRGAHGSNHRYFRQSIEAHRQTPERTQRCAKQSNGHPVAGRARCYWRELELAERCNH